MNSNQNRNRPDTAHQIKPQTRPDDRSGTRPDDRTEGYRTGYNAVHRYKSKVIA